MENNWYLHHLPQANSSILCTALAWNAKISNALITPTINHHFYTKSPLLQNHHFYHMVQTGCESEQKTLWFPAEGLWSPLSPSRTKELSSHTGHGSQRTPVNTLKSHQWPQQTPAPRASCTFLLKHLQLGQRWVVGFFLLLNSCRCGPEFCKSKIEGANIPVPFPINPFEMLKCH